MKRRKSSAIEWLCVGVMLAVLAAAVRPALAQIVTPTPAVTCFSNLHRIGVAMRLYLADHDERFFDFKDAHWVIAPPFSPFPWPDMWPVLAPYVSTSSVFICPQDTGQNSFR